MAMVMDTMVIPMATTMETMVTGIVVIMVQGVAPVIGGEMKGQGKVSNLLGLSPCGINIRTPIIPPSLFRRYPLSFMITKQSPQRRMRQGQGTSFDPRGNK